MSGHYGALIDGLVALEQQVATDIAALPDLAGTEAGDLRVYPLRPHGSVELPAIWNWYPDVTYDLADTENGEEHATVAVRIGIRHTDSDEELSRLLTYADVFIERVDQALLDWAGVDLGDSAQEAQRTRMRTINDQFGDVPVLCAEFQIRTRLRWLVRTTS